MASTPSSRLKPTPSNSPHLTLPVRSLNRGRASVEPRLSLKRVVGTTCTSPTGFDTVGSLFAYIAGGAVVVVDVDGAEYAQRFYRARPTALPVYNTSLSPYSPSTPTATPKANDSRNRASLRESSYGSADWAESPTPKTWTSRERIKAATCLALSKEGKFLAVGETGYAPRVLIYSLEDNSSDIPLVSISEHGFGVRAVAWSSDSRYLASLGSANDGFLYIWKIDPKTGAARLFQQNRCTSYIRGMIWVGSSLVTLGVRHIKVWRIDEAQVPSLPKQKFAGDPNTGSPAHQKTLPGRNVLLGGLIDATFSCAVAVDDTKAIICSETGEVCLFDDADKQMKLTNVLESGFVTTCVTIRGDLAYLGGKSGHLATFDLASFVKCSTDAICRNLGSFEGLFALGFLKENMVTVDAKRSIHIWKFGDKPDEVDLKSSPIPIPGHQDPVLGIEALGRPNASDADFYSWSGSGEVILWDVEGNIKSCFKVPLEEACFDDESDLVNQLALVRATEGGKFFVVGDKLGIVKIIDFLTLRCVSSMKAHASDCQSIATYEDKSRFVIATCGRDRTTQLFRQTANGEFEHFQTLEFASRVVQVIVPSADRVITCSLDRTLQVHELVTKNDDPNVMAAIHLRTLPLKSSPASMTMNADGKSVYVSLLDRSVSAFDVENGKLSNTFKCIDESGIESVVLESLTSRSATDKEPAFLLGISNTDKSIRIYDAQTGAFLDREWGHTESIKGVALVEEEGTRRVVSVGSDGTIMIWEMDLPDRAWSSTSREPSPVKDGSTLTRPTLRRVLSKAELAEFQRSSPAGGRRSPPRTLTKKRSAYNMSSTSSARAPSSTAQASPTVAIAEDTPSRRPSTDSRSGSPPPVSPKTKVRRRPSLPALNSAKTKSNGNLRGFGSLDTATEQACRTLRAYRKKLSSTDPVSHEILAELDQELRLTAVALGDRTNRSKAMSDTMLNGLLDQYSERLINMLDEKLRFGFRSHSDQEPDSPSKRPGSSGAGSSNSSA
ncbi:WD domain-containing protein [Durotheca rogersii]|uniref:WD domain-containing protein n=1 Tax=Durotheca rogersii TaxID=419775 RepID=UPI00221E8331|nr:WD domain-containing protein [Durotheca rogersii]KAI5863465.1 WD domain-containing protein [Durotheca rogersii]